MKNAVIALLVAFIFFNLLVIGLNLNTVFLQPTETSGSTSGNISLVILDSQPAVTIHSPENITYNRPLSFNNSYILLFNATDNFGANAWTYNFTGLKHGDSYQYGSSNYIPHPSFDRDFVRWGNYLEVFAENTFTGVNATANVTFYLHVNNTEPEFLGLPNETYFCEGDPFLFEYHAIDYDEDYLFLSINQTGPFFSTESNTLNQTSAGRLGQGGNTTAKNIIFMIGEPRFTKDHFRNSPYLIPVRARDNGVPEDAAIQMLNLTVIEINNAPTLTSLENQSVWTIGENITFYTQIEVTDTESGNEDSGNFTFNLIFKEGVTPFFGVNNLGVINFTANDSLLGPNNSSRVYNMSLCVTDLPLSNPHVNITEFCGSNAGNEKQVCRDWSLTVTADNRPPRILNFNPSSLNFSASRGPELYFNITDYDPDGTVPDTYWYVDGVSEEFDNQSLFDEFYHIFPCGESGVHFVKVLVSDGLLNSSITWNVTLDEVACSQPSNSGGGGGGGGGPSCVPLWICQDWNTCETLASGLENGTLAGDDYREVQEECAVSGWTEESICGFQTRNCQDSANCGITNSNLLQACYYTENPTCSDGIKNCHDGGCEFLVDCGGPCGACATCSDGIQNQGEEKVDCGGPCPRACPIEIPGGTAFLNYLIVLIIVILVVIVLFLVYRVRKEKRLGR